MKKILDFKLFTESIEGEESLESSTCKWCGANFKSSYKEQECCSDEHLAMFMDREVEENS